MIEEELRKLQDDLDNKKYNQSCLARTDLSGRMEYCRGCLFKTDLPICILDHETRYKFCVCARNCNRLEEEKNATRKSTGRTRRSN